MSARNFLLSATLISRKLRLLMKKKKKKGSHKLISVLRNYHMSLNIAPASYRDFEYSKFPGLIQPANSNS